MSNSVAIRPELTPDDRLSLTFCLALLFHALIILGIVFAPEDKINPRYESMEIVLVQQSSEPAKEADVLAQANLRGGGDVSEKFTPASPLPFLPPEDQTEVAAPVETEITEPGPAPAQEVVEHLAVEVEKTSAALEESPVKPEPNHPSASELLSNSLRMAALISEVKRKLETKAKRPKRTFISASTREYKYAAYMEAWRAKVERVGNLNYPEEARKRKISGQLVLDVAVEPGRQNKSNYRPSFLGS